MRDREQQILVAARWPGSAGRSGLPGLARSAICCSARRDPRGLQPKSPWREQRAQERHLPAPSAATPPAPTRTARRPTVTGMSPTPAKAARRPTKARARALERGIEAFPPALPPVLTVACTGRHRPDPRHQRGTLLRTCSGRDVVKSSRSGVLRRPKHPRCCRAAVWVFIPPPARSRPRTRRCSPPGRGNGREPAVP
jgi:hypothetical protein